MGPVSQRKECSRRQEVYNNKEEECTKEGVIKNGSGSDADEVKGSFDLSHSK